MQTNIYHNSRLVLVARSVGSLALYGDMISHLKGWEWLATSFVSFITLGKYSPIDLSKAGLVRVQVEQLQVSWQVVMQDARKK